MLFCLEEGRRDAGEVGVDPWVNPADSVVAESLHPSDIASVVARTEITLLTEGAVAAMPDHSGPQATESIGIGSEAGFVTTERPNAVVQGLPEQPRANYNWFPVQPDFILSPLLKDGADCLRPSAGTGGAHDSEWLPKLMSHDWSYAGLSSRFTEEDLPEYFFSAPQNFDRFCGGNRSSSGGILPLPPLPPLPGVSSSGAPLTAEEKGTKGTAPGRLHRVGAPDRWEGKKWDQPPPPIDEYATPSQKLAWRLHVGMGTRYERGSTPESIFQASQLLWNNAFGCLPLIEDAILISLGYQFFHREGDGFCFGGPLKKV